MNKEPWYTSRLLTRLLGGVGVACTLVGSCVRLETLDTRSSCRGDILQSNAYNAPVFSTDSQKVFGFVDHTTPGKHSQTLEAWETAQGRRLWKVPLSSDGLALATQGDRVATMTFKELAVRDTRTGRVLWQNTRTIPLSEHATLSFSPSGKLLALTLPDFIQVLDVATGKSLKGIAYTDCKFHQQPVFLSDGTLVVAECATVSGDPYPGLNLRLSFSTPAVSVVTVLDPLTGKALRRLARDVEDWCVSPDGTRVLVKRAHELLLLSPSGETLATVSPGKYFEQYVGARFIPGSTNILLIGDNAGDTPVRSYVWNPTQHIVRRAHPDEELHEQAYSREGSKALRAEDMGGLGRHKPLGTVMSPNKAVAPVPLEGMTGWELK
ncbi:WD40 repeat domain-containing protein [Armatimonas rosea]|uniref:PQQ-like domain-containing protein n=1 Tax=Armatimonas rosea TaxID=685828 RepID=A0A7W9SVX2_ARMRO|nr:hypothetical protein [Armatimonas rosea]MBB6053363.1 hypothetical protein [Armatimonas rosea]